MDKRLAALAALVVALATGSWAALKACASEEEPVADSGAGEAPGPVIDAGDTNPPAPEVDSGVVVVPPPSGSSLFVSAYYAAWFPEMYPHDKIDFSAFTHLIIGRAAPRGDGSLVQAFDSSVTRGMTRAKDLSGRAHAAGRKAILMLGGAGDGAAFRDASTPERLGTFAASILAFVDATEMDGVDLDWEENIVHSQWLALVKELKERRPGLIVTIPVFPVNVNQGLSAAERAFFAAVHPYVDQVNTMTYGIGMAGPWGGWVTWHTGALTGDGPTHPTSMASTLGAYAAAGVPKSKLGMGIGFYGINYGPPNVAPYERPSGAYQADDVEWRYGRLVRYFGAGEYHWDDEAKMGYRSFPGGFSPGAGFSTAGFLSYEDERSIAAKGEWTKANGYGGAMLWVLNYGCTNAASGDNPLLTATRRAFLE